MSAVEPVPVDPQSIGAIDSIDILRERWFELLTAIKALPEPDRTLMLREVRARAAASIETPKRSAASTANMTRLNEARREYGVSEETRARLSAAQKAAWSRRKAQTNPVTPSETPYEY